MNIVGPLTGLFFFFMVIYQAPPDILCKIFIQNKIFCGSILGGGGRTCQKCEDISIDCFCTARGPTQSILKGLVVCVCMICFEARPRCPCPVQSISWSGYTEDFGPCGPCAFALGMQLCDCQVICLGLPTLFSFISPLHSLFLIVSFSTRRNSCQESF